MYAREKVTGLSLEWGEPGAEIFGWEGSTTPHCSTRPWLALHISRFPRRDIVSGWILHQNNRLGLMHGVL